MLPAVRRYTTRQCSVNSVYLTTTCFYLFCYAAIYICLSFIVPCFCNKSTRYINQNAYLIEHMSTFSDAWQRGVVLTSVTAIQLRWHATVGTCWASGWEIDFNHCRCSQQVYRCPCYCIHDVNSNYQQIVPNVCNTRPATCACVR